MAHTRTFVQLDAAGNVAGCLESEHPPGSDPAVVPDGHYEVTGTDRSTVDWMRYRWNGSAFVERTDLDTGAATDAADTVDARLTRIEALLETLTP